MIKQWIISSIAALMLISWLTGCGGGGDTTSTPAAPVGFSAISMFSSQQYMPGYGFTVSISVTPLSSTHIYTVEESAPEGWTITAPSNNGTVTESRFVRWQFQDNLARTLTYTVTPPVNGAGSQTFSGTVIYEAGESIEISGDRTISLNPATPTTPSAASTFSVRQYTPGTDFRVYISVIPVGANSSYAVQDTVPAGWTVSQIDNDGAWDTANGMVKWIFTDNSPRTLSYHVLPPANASGSASFIGTASFGTGDSATDKAIVGERTISQGAVD